MAMSKLLAEDRAKQIWGDQVKEVSATKIPHEDCWNVFLYSKIAYWHKLDGNGHAICHTDCADVEVQLCV